MARLTVWHRRAGLAAAIGVICWALSGVIHPIMARIQPRPVPVQVAPDPAPQARGPGLGEVLQRHRIESISDARVVQVAGRLHYQITRPGQALREYFSLDDAAPAPQGDRLHAERLARQWAGEPSAPVRSARLQEQFDREYSAVNRLLPVWRIEFDRPDDMTVFVDTGSDRLGALVDVRRRLSAALFSTLHRWDWLESRAPMLRLGLLTAMLMAALLATVIGVWMFFRRSGSRRAWGLRRIHRLAGLSVSVAAIAFLGSGLYHLLHSGLRGDPAVRLLAEPASISPDALRIGFAEAVDRSGVPAPARVSLAEIEGVLHYRIESVQPAGRGRGEHHGAAAANAGDPKGAPAAAPSGTAASTPVATPSATAMGHGHRSGQPASSATRGGGASGHHDHVPPPAGGAADPRRPAAPPVYVSAIDGRVLPEGEARYAAWIARRASGRAPRGEIEPVTRFGGEYGFVYKRLPVQRVQLEGADALVVYVDTASRAVAATIDAPSRLEGWVFSNVHKQDWLVPVIGRDARDVLVAVAALGIGGVATLGLLLFARGRGARRRGRSTAREA